MDLAATKRFIAAEMHTRFLDMEGVMMSEPQYKCSLAESGCDNITNIKTKNKQNNFCTETCEI